MSNISFGEYNVEKPVNNLTAILIKCSYYVSCYAIVLLYLIEHKKCLYSVIARLN
jgi:hypothetical protein